MQQRREVFSFRGGLCIYAPRRRPEAVSKLESREEEKWTTGSSLLKALTAAAYINKETTWEKLGSTGVGSPSVGTLLHFRRNAICEAVVTLVPGVVIFEHI